MVLCILSQFPEFSIPCQFFLDSYKTISTSCWWNFDMSNFKHKSLTTGWHFCNFSRGSSSAKDLSKKVSSWKLVIACSRVPDSITLVIITPHISLRWLFVFKNQFLPPTSSWLTTGVTLKETHFCVIVLVGAEFQWKPPSIAFLFLLFQLNVSEIGILT